MSTRKTQLIAALLASLFAGAAFAAGTSGVAAPETPGSAAAQAVAEATHLARMHGLPQVKQPIAQAAGSEQPQSAAEAIHLPKQHGNINDSADRRMLRDAARL